MCHKVTHKNLIDSSPLKTLLSGNGYEVFVVTDFSQTIQQIKAFVPHLVILDRKLPGNNGFEICSEIRTFSDIPIVFVTSSNTDMDELNSIMLGGDAFITKPYNKSVALYGVRFSTLQTNSAIANNFILQTGMIYGAVVLMVICLTVLSLQQLLDAGQYKYRFSVLRKLGVEEHPINKLILKLPVFALLYELVFQLHKAI